MLAALKPSPLLTPYIHTYTHIPWSVHKLLDHDLVVPEALSCLAATGIQRLLKITTAQYDAHSLTTSTQVSLDHHRVTEGTKIIL